MFHHLLHLTHIDHSVIKAIFHFLNSDAKNLIVAIPFENKFHTLKSRIEANFVKKKHHDVKDIFAANWANIECVEYFIEKNFSEYEEQLYSVLERIRNYFKNVPYNHKGIVDYPVNDPRYFEELSSLLIPSCKKNDPRFMMAAKAIVLFFFKSGEFGRKTPYDPPTLFTKYSNVNDYSSF